MKEKYNPIGDSIVDKLAKKGDPHAIEEQRRVNMVYRRASLGDPQSIDELKRLGWTDIDLLANQVQEYEKMGLSTLAQESWNKLVKLYNND